MKTIDEQYARLEKLLDDEKIYLVRGVSFADLCVALGADRQAMDDHLQKELGMDGEALMQTFRQRDMERWEQRFGIRVKIYYQVFCDWRKKCVDLHDMPFAYTQQ